MDNTTPPKTMMDLAPSLRSPGFRLVDAGEMYALFRSIFSTQSGISARGTTQATGLQLTAGVNVLNTVQAANNAVVLPPGLPGKQVIIANMTGQAAAIFGFRSDTIVPLGAGTGGAVATVALAAGNAIQLVCVSLNSVTGVALWKVLSLG